MTDLITKLLNKHPDELGDLYKKKKILLASDKGYRIKINKSNHKKLALRTYKNGNSTISLHFKPSLSERMPNYILSQRHKHIWDICRGRIETFPLFVDERLEANIVVLGKNYPISKVNVSSTLSLFCRFNNFDATDLADKIKNEDYEIVFYVKMMGEERLAGETRFCLNKPIDQWHRKIVETVKEQFLDNQNLSKKYLHLSEEDNGYKYYKEIAITNKYAAKIVFGTEEYDEEMVNDITFNHLIRKTKTFKKLLSFLYDSYLLSYSFETVYKELKNPKLKKIILAVDNQLKV